MTENGEHGANPTLHHRPPGPIVMALDQASGVGQDLVVVLDHAVRRQPAVLLPQAHRAAGRMEAQPDLLRGGDLGRDQITAATRVHVEVVGGRGAPSQGQLAQADPRRHVRRLLVQAAPDRIQGPQPVEQVARQRGPERPGEVLVDVVMGVDQTGRDEAAVRPDHPAGGRFTPGPAHPDDEPVPRRHPATGDLAALTVLRGDELRTRHHQVDGLVSGRAHGLGRYRAPTTRAGARTAELPHGLVAGVSAWAPVPARGFLPVTP